MRRYLLDSAPVAAYLQGRNAAVDLITPWIVNREAATSILVYAEVVEYLKGLSDFSRRHDNLRRLLRPPHGTGLIGDIDTLIAATALEQNLTIVTVDSDFERVPGLKVLKVVLKA